MEEVGKNLIESEIDKKQDASITPEYKASWSDVNIQADYDQYARSVNPSRLQNNSISPKQADSASPKLKESDSVQSKTTPRKGRVRLQKSENQIVKAPNLAQENNKQTTQNSSKSMMQADGKANKSLQEKRSPEHENVKTPTELQQSSDEDLSPRHRSDVQRNSNKEEHDSKELNNFPLDAEDIQPKSISAKPTTVTRSQSKEKQFVSKQQIARRTRYSNKSSLEFTPPVVTAVDFRQPCFTQAVKQATKDGLLIDNSGCLDYHPQDGSNSRMSTLLMASYLGMGYSPNPNIITSISVKPLLPPLSVKRKPGIRRRPPGKRGNVEESPDLGDKKKAPDLVAPKGNEAEKLAPLRDAHLYKWKHNPASHDLPSFDQGKPIPYRVPARRSDVETVFDQIVRWRSKVRHCGKPAMYRRVTSPTLGEEALRRKLTDRLPSRQIRRIKERATASRLIEQPDIVGKKTSVETSTSSVKHYIKERLKDARNHGSLTSPASAIDEFCDVSTKLKKPGYRRHFEFGSTRNEYMQHQLADLLLRKRHPVWQRMK